MISQPITAYAASLVVALAGMTPALPAPAFPPSLPAAQGGCGPGNLDIELPDGNGGLSTACTGSAFTPDQQATFDAALDAAAQADPAATLSLLVDMQQGDVSVGAVPAGTGYGGLGDGNTVLLELTGDPAVDGMRLLHEYEHTQDGQGSPDCDATASDCAHAQIYVNGLFNLAAMFAEGYSIPCFAVNNQVKQAEKHNAACAASGGTPAAIPSFPEFCN